MGRKNATPRVLKVARGFEPSRIGSQVVTASYETLLPIVKKYHVARDREGSSVQRRAGEQRQ